MRPEAGPPQACNASDRRSLSTNAPARRGDRAARVRARAAPRARVARRRAATTAARAPHNGGRARALKSGPVDGAPGPRPAAGEASRAPRSARSHKATATPTRPRDLEMNYGTATRARTPQRSDRLRDRQPATAPTQKADRRAGHRSPQRRLDYPPQAARRPTTSRNQVPQPLHRSTPKIVSQESHATCLNRSGIGHGGDARALSRQPAGDGRTGSSVLASELATGVASSRRHGLLSLP